MEQHSTITISGKAFAIPCTMPPAGAPAHVRRHMMAKARRAVWFLLSASKRTAPAITGYTGPLPEYATGHGFTND